MEAAVERGRYAMTTKQLAEVLRLAKEGYCDTAIGLRVGVSVSSVRYWRTKEGIPVGKKEDNRGTKRNVYVFYDRKSSQYLCEGTVPQIANALGISPKSIHSIISRTRSGALKKYEIFGVEE